MCIAYPARILQIDGEVAIVLARGRHQRVPLIALDEPVEVDDWILVQTGLAVSKLTNPVDDPIGTPEMVLGGWS